MPIDRKRAEVAITEFLRAIGYEPDADPELADTGKRVTEAFLDELVKGERESAEEVLRENVLVTSGADDLVILRDVPLSTMCPHHLMPASGFATVAFQPKGKIVGIGAIARVVEVFSKRLSLQETMGEKICSSISTELSAVWVGCRIALTHTCLVVRDERRRGSIVETIALRGEVDRALAYRVLGATP